MKRFAVLFLIFFWRWGVAAQTPCPLGDYPSLLSCAEERSLEVQSARLELERARAQTQTASQWRNPELSAESFQGTLAGDKRGETNISVAVPIEIGGQIKARTAVADGGVAVAEAKLLEVRSVVRRDVFLKMHRLRQVIHEQQVVEEAIQTFGKLVGQYAKRPGLSPEQQISASVFQLSKSDYELKKSVAADEIAALNSFFRRHLGLGASQVQTALPPSPRSWPTTRLDAGPGVSATMRILQAQLQTAEAELAVARSEAWPTLMLGPSFKMLNEGGQSGSLLGFNLSFPLPLFNVNGGARASAAAVVKASTVQRDRGRDELSLHREELVQVYEQATKALSASLSHEEIEKRHADAERLFARGVVPSSLVIEAHRTSFDLEKSRHERELKALETLLEIYSIDGTILEVRL